MPFQPRNTSEDPTARYQKTLSAKPSIRPAVDLGTFTHRSTNILFHRNLHAPTANPQRGRETRAVNQRLTANPQQLLGTWASRVRRFPLFYRELDSNPGSLSPASAKFFSPIQPSRVEGVRRRPSLAAIPGLNPAGHPARRFKRTAALALTIRPTTALAQPAHATTTTATAMPMQAPMEPLATTPPAAVHPAVPATALPAAVLLHPAAAVRHPAAAVHPAAVHAAVLLNHRHPAAVPAAVLSHKHKILVHQFAGTRS